LEIRFGPFALNPDTRQLTRNGSEIHISRKAFELLATLLAERPKVVSKAALQEHLWPGTFVVEANLSNLIAEIRDALGDEPRSPRFVRTSHGFGYAFFGEVVTAPPVGPEVATPRTMASWLECQGRQFPLAPGENIIGRDPDLAVSLIAPTVSRRHARVLVLDDGATIEDFGSKNGTFVGGVPVRSSAPLAHGDVIHFGTLPATFYVRQVEAVTETAVKRPV
jgi:DNA-binding winged helix-turn-helix (wHTH) protein